MEEQTRKKIQQEIERLERVLSLAERLVQIPRKHKGYTRSNLCEDHGVTYGALLGIHRKSLNAKDAIVFLQKTLSEDFDINKFRKNYISGGDLRELLMQCNYEEDKVNFFIVKACHSTGLLRKEEVTKRRLGISNAYYRDSKCVLDKDGARKVKRKPNFFGQDVFIESSRSPLRIVSGAYGSHQTHSGSNIINF